MNREHAHIPMGTKHEEKPLNIEVQEIQLAEASKYARKNKTREKQITPPEQTRTMSAITEEKMVDELRKKIDTLDEQMDMASKVHDSFSTKTQESESSGLLQLPPKKSLWKRIFSRE